MTNANMKSKKIRTTSNASSERESVLENKTTKYSLASIAVIAACGAIGFALSRPSNRRRIKQYADRATKFSPGGYRKINVLGRLGNQLADFADIAKKR